MTRIPEVDLARAPAATRTALSAAPDLSIFRVAAHAETVLGPWLDTGRALLDSPAIPPALRELIIIQVAVITRCPYVRTRHEQVAAELGVTSEEITAVLDGVLDDDVLPETGAILRVVEEIARTHTARADGIEYLQARLGERGAVEVLIIIGYYIGLSILASSADLATDVG